jgi:integrase
VSEQVVLNDEMSMIVSQEVAVSIAAIDLAARIINTLHLLRGKKDVALAQKYLDALLPKPKLPRRPKKRAKFFTLANVARVIVASEGEDRVFYWLVAETGLRSGELAGLRLTDIDGERLTVNQSVWLGREQAPKTNNSIRSLALSPQLISLLWEQIARQRAKGHDFLFSSNSGRPKDMNVYRRRKMTALLKSLEIPQAGFHAFRHFNVAMLDALRVPLKTIQERIGHALTRHTLG